MESIVSQNEDKVKSSCSLFGIILTLLLVLFIVAALLIYGSYKYKKFELSASKPTNGASDIAKLTSAPSGGAVLTLSEEDLTNILFKEGFPLVNPTLKISDVVEIRGKTKDSIFSPTLQIELLPEVKDEKISIKLVSIKASGFPAPKFITEKLSRDLEEKIDLSNSSELQGKVNKIDLKTGYLIIYYNQ